MRAELDDLSVCVNLRRVDLSKNALQSVEGLAFNKELTWVSISNNQVESLADMAKLPKLQGAPGASPLPLLLTHR